MDRTTLRRLDFPLFLEILARRAPTDRARRSILALVPDSGKAEERYWGMMRNALLMMSFAGLERQVTALSI